MTQIDQTLTRAEELGQLHQTAAGTPMGALLRRFWQPIALTRDIDPGGRKPVRVMGEDLTLYRGDSGKPYLVAGRCAHRMTVLHTGWVEGEEIRCLYHGWKYDGTGQCQEMPAERDGLAETVKIAAYPVRDYCGLIFAYMGEGEAPAFELPRKEVAERSDRILFTRKQTWPCNWLQSVENSLDATHVSFVHMKGRVGIFGEAVTPAIPKLDYVETDAGIRQTATRADNNVRISDWTFPNNNHIIIPGAFREDPWLDLILWMVPDDDYATTRFQLYSIPSIDEERDRRVAEHFAKHAAYTPAEHHDELFFDEIYPQENLLELTNAQDYVAAVGQGAIVDRANERLGASDAGVALVRKVFLRELKEMRDGRTLKEWRPLEQAQELPVPGTIAASG